jgi:prepilin-type N-terminal cleavage/methylation domain-containing protein/prepilin-type processing-associated H-X9-DG protein
MHRYREPALRAFAQRTADSFALREEPWLLSWSGASPRGLPPWDDDRKLDRSLLQQPLLLLGLACGQPQEEKGQAHGAFSSYPSLLQGGKPRGGDSLDRGQCPRRAFVPSRLGASRSAFTLVELLVVIAIAALLVAMVVPSLARARHSAKETVCLAQVKGMMTAIQAYAVENRGTIAYGPTAPPPSPSNLYPVTGLVTSQISLSKGQPVGLGLLLAGYLDRNPTILFCPGADEPIDAKRELSKVGKSQAISSYYYRHGSNTLATLHTPHSTWTDHIRIENLGRNAKGDPIRALVVDQNFLTSVPMSAFGIFVRTNHRQKRVNAGFADGHAETRLNRNGRYTVDVGNFPFNGPNKMIEVFERLDQP